MRPDGHVSGTRIYPRPATWPGANRFHVRTTGPGFRRDIRCRLRLRGAKQAVALAFHRTLPWVATPASRKGARPRLHSTRVIRSRFPSAFFLVASFHSGSASGPSGRARRFEIPRVVFGALCFSGSAVTSALLGEERGGPPPAALAGVMRGRGDGCPRVAHYHEIAGSNPAPASREANGRRLRGGFRGLRVGLDIHGRMRTPAPVMPRSVTAANSARAGCEHRPPMCLVNFSF